MRGARHGLTAADAVVDTTKASIARVYDAVLGGHDNYEVDRALLAEILKITPQAPLIAKALRRWLVETTRFLAGRAGMDQFLDCGSGLPTADNTHHVAQRCNPDAVVVYADNDPAVHTHSRALLANNDKARFVAADLTAPGELLALAAEHLDFRRPVALVQCATLHHVADDAGPARIMAEYREALASGAYVALTHWHDPEHPGECAALARSVETTYRTSSSRTGIYRTRDEIRALLAGLDLVEPGLAELDRWWPDGSPRASTSAQHLFLAAVGRKP